MEKNCRLSLVTKKDSFDTGLDAFLRSTASSKKARLWPKNWVCVGLDSFNFKASHQGGCWGCGLHPLLRLHQAWGAYPGRGEPDWGLRRENLVQEHQAFGAQLVPVVDVSTCRLDSSFFSSLPTAHLRVCVGAAATVVGRHWKRWNFARRLEEMCFSKHISKTTLFQKVEGLGVNNFSQQEDWKQIGGLQDWASSVLPQSEFGRHPW